MVAGSPIMKLGLAKIHLLRVGIHDRLYEHYSLNIYGHPKFICQNHNLIGDGIRR
jgi:hypothetical protein